MTLTSVIMKGRSRKPLQDRMYTQGSPTHNTFSQYHVLVPCLRCIIDDGIILAMMLTSVIIRGRVGGTVAGSPGMSPPDQHGGLSWKNSILFLRKLSQVFEQWSFGLCFKKLFVKLNTFYTWCVKTSSCTGCKLISEKKQQINHQRQLVYQQLSDALLR